MRVILEIASGSNAGKRVWLQRGQVLHVGGTEEADFAVDDAEMAAVHFSLRTDPHGCHLEDCETETGTLVNGTPVRAALLNNGDRIQAGSTTLVVRIDGAPRGEAAAAPAPPSSASREAAAPPSLNDVPCYEQACGSGMVLLEGIDEAPAGPEIVAPLAAMWPLYLAVDFGKLEQPPPDDLDPSHYLLDWMVDEIRTHHSPVVFPPEMAAQRLPLVEQGWGKDAVVCLFSQRPVDEVFASLRMAASFNPSTGIHAQGEMMLAFWWPNIFRLVLIHSPKRHVMRLMEGIDAVLLEGPDRQQWQLFAKPEFVEPLKGAGFAPRPPEPLDEPVTDKLEVPAVETDGAPSED